MKKILKRWGTILLGFCFIKAIDIVDVLFVEENYQFIFRIMCLVGAAISFVVSIVTDENLRFKSNKENRWIILFVNLCIVVMSLVIVILLIVGFMNLI